MDHDTVIVAKRDLWFVLYRVHEFWRVYVGDDGEQVFTSKKAVKTARELVRKNPTGYSEVRVSRAASTNNWEHLTGEQPGGRDET